jgi:hypothetical protein
MFSSSQKNRNQYNKRIHANAKKSNCHQALWRRRLLVMLACGRPSRNCGAEKRNINVAPANQIKCHRIKN